MINSNHIYLYNDLSISSVHKTLDLNPDYLHITSNYKDTFINICDNFDWSLKTIPYLYIEPPFEESLNFYILQNNCLTINNHDKYFT